MGKFWPVAEYLSLKQGLKTANNWHGWCVGIVVEYLPLK